MRLFLFYVLFFFIQVVNAQLKHISYKDKTAKAKLSFHTNIWDASELRSNVIHYTHNSKKVFNGFCIGWDATNPSKNPDNKHIEYRIKNINGKWTKWQERFW